jgi:predicted phage-related endonuclease
LKSYLGNTAGYFQLKRKMKEESFKKGIEEKLKDLKESDVVLYKVCLLPEACFNSIIKYCLF